ncbi:uncharacterized protein LOC110669812 isoform X12 [Hevea brasiliensis]|uniref:uncharacterized protein LOC110669812 isoform X12 n=1 Tax=Hevea brasiliensis TaxID=3981 RepID=UPI0025E857FB|nr:uncharacterized protein LOC110669812 isoform X12 [Hevea brasiliensis]
MTRTPAVLKATVSSLFVILTLPEGLVLTLILSSMVAGLTVILLPSAVLLLLRDHRFRLLEPRTPPGLLIPNQFPTVTNLGSSILLMGNSKFSLLQGVYNPYAGQQYVQVYGMPGTVNPGVSSRGQFGQPIPGTHGYTTAQTAQNYLVPGHQIAQFGGLANNRTATATFPSNQAPHPSGMGNPDSGQAQIIVSTNSPQFTSGSD